MLMIISRWEIRELYKIWFVKTIDGYFPTNLTEEDIRDIDINKEIYFNIGRYDLIDFLNNENLQLVFFS